MVDDVEGPLDVVFIVVFVQMSDSLTSRLQFLKYVQQT